MTSQKQNAFRLPPFVAARAYRGTRRHVGLDGGDSRKASTSNEANTVREEEGPALVLTGQAKPSYALALRFMLGEEGDGE